MPEEQLQGENPGESQEGSQPGVEQEESAGSEKPEVQEPGPIPYDRFKEVNERAKAYEKRLAEIEAKNLEREKAEDKERQRQLREQEQFKELADEWEGKFNDLEPKYTALQEQLDNANKLLQSYADAQMDSVPELFQPVVSNLPLTERLEWLTANKDKLGKAKPSGIPATPQGQGRGEVSEEQRRRQSARTF